MNARVAALWRHPIKGHGFEALRSVALTAGQTVPGDRLWAVLVEGGKADGTAWAPCMNFARGAKTGTLMAMAATLSEDGTGVTLTHPDLAPLSFHPESDAQRFFDWLAPLLDPARAAPVRILRAPAVGWTDSPFPSVSILSTSSLAALAEHIGTPLEQQRFRGNIWLDGAPAWAEWDWIGRTLHIGDVELEVRERITRCVATQIDTATGARTADTLAGLSSGWGHIDFGVYAVVTKSGAVAPGDEARVL